MTEKVYVLVDGENIDTTLGKILERKPHSEDRTRWQFVLGFAQRLHPEAEIKGLFFLNTGPEDYVPVAFIKALSAIGFTSIPLKGSGGAHEQVVDTGIIQMMRSILDCGEGHVLVVSNDGGYAAMIRQLLEAGHKVAILGFTEFLSSSYTNLVELGLEIYDLENDVEAFEFELPRQTRIIELDTFDPTYYL